VQRWGIWRSIVGGLIVRCPKWQLTIRHPWAHCLFSDRQRLAVMGWRFIVRRWDGEGYRV